MMGLFVGVATTEALASDGNIAVSYFGGTPTNWSDYPMIIVPIALCVVSFVVFLMQAFKLWNRG